jgi:hypothetical protein
MITSKNAYECFMEAKEILGNNQIIPEIDYGYIQRVWEDWYMSNNKRRMKHKPIRRNRLLAKVRKKMYKPLTISQDKYFLFTVD